MILDVLVLVFLILTITFFSGARICKKGCKPWFTKNPKTEARLLFWLGVISLILFIVLLLIQLPGWK